MKFNKILNFLFLGILLSYFALLISRLIVERIPRAAIPFLLFYCLLGSLFSLWSLLKKLTLKINKLKTNNEEKSNIKRFFLKIKTNFLVLVYLILEKIKTFFFVFLYHNKKIKFIYFSLVKFFEKTVDYRKTYLFFFVALPWAGFILTSFYEIFSGDFFFFSLYFLSFNTLMRVLLKLILEISKKVAPGFSQVNLLIYLPRINSEFGALNFFVNNNAFRDKCLFFELLTSKERLFFWELFTKYHFFYLLSLKIKTLEYLLDTFTSFFKKITLLIFFNLLISLIFLSNKIFVIGLSFFTVFFAFFLLVNFLHETNSPQVIYNELYEKKQEIWFLKTREELVVKFGIPFSLLPYPFTNVKTAKILLNEDLELANICALNEQFPQRINFHEFEQFSNFKLTKEECLVVNFIENELIAWFIELRDANLIDPLTAEIKIKN